MKNLNRLRPTNINKKRVASTVAIATGVAIGAKVARNRSKKKKAK